MQNNPEQPQNQQPPYGAYPQMQMQQPPKKKSRVWLIVGILVGAFVLCGLCGGIGLAIGSNKSSNTATASQPNTTTKADTTSAPPPTRHFKIGETVSVGNTWQITITSIRTSPGGTYIKPSKDADQFLIISTTMKNISDKEQESYGVAGYKLRDTDGTQMSIAIYTDDNVQQAPSGKVEAGSQIKGDLVYEVPKVSKNLQLFYENNLFESGQVIWDITVS